MSIQLKDFDRWIRSFLNLEEMASVDSSKNGLQVDRQNQSLTKVAFAVDACMETFRISVEQQADLLFVHHGLYWGREQVLIDTHYKRIRYLMTQDLGLYAVHLPLDAHPQVGNNAQMAQALGLKDCTPFGRYKGFSIGIQGMLPEPWSPTEVISKLFGEAQRIIRHLPFGKPLVQKVAMISGGGVHEVEQAIEAGVDLYITGDANHVVYHRCMEAGIHVVFAGHYLTETWGPRAVMKKFSEETGLASCFIDVPTGL